MSPDLNSLSTSRQPSMPGSPLSQRPRRISLNAADVSRPSPPSPRSPSLSSLQAAATINAGLHRSPSRVSPRLERRRSSLMNNISINDPTVPGPGELQQSSLGNAGSPRLSRRSFVLGTADLHHHRQPSLGELHQELENEQEAQVNRLLHMIRVQQDQLAAYQRQQPLAQESSPTSTEPTGIPTPPSTLHTPSSTATAEQASSRPISISNFPHSQYGHFNRPHSLSRQSSARPSNIDTSSTGNSPASRPHSGSLGPLTEDYLLGGTRDECAFYQAETQTLTRENQMLKLRIRELERQISDMGGPSNGHFGGSLPSHNSPLAGQPATFRGEAISAVPAETRPII